MIKTKTWGNISAEGFEFGLRNEGVRAWSEEESAMLFWEFDVFGGITEGRVKAEGKDLYLHYIYDFGTGPTGLTDAWLYQDEDSYKFVVGVYRNGEWKQKFLSIIMKRTE